MTQRLKPGTVSWPTIAAWAVDFPTRDPRRFICVVQQGDGNFQVLRTESPEDCENKSGTSLFQSGFSLEQPSEKYYTRLQRDGNLITRTTDRKKTVWKTCSAQANADDEFSLVLNEDETLSILSSDGSEIWNSETDETCYIDRPLVLMSSASGGRNIHRAPQPA